MAEFKKRYDRERSMIRLTSRRVEGRPKRLSSEDFENALLKKNDTGRSMSEIAEMLKNK